MNETVTSFEETVQALACDNAARVMGRPLRGRSDLDMSRKNVDQVPSSEEFAYNGFSNEPGTAGYSNKDEKLLSDSAKLLELCTTLNLIVCVCLRFIGSLQRISSS